MLRIWMVVVFAGTASCLISHSDAEVIDTITFPDAKCDGTRCYMELAAGGQLFSLYMEHTVDIAPPHFLIEEVYSDRTVSRRVKNPQGCVHYGKVVRNGVVVGSMVLSLCDTTKTATLYTDEGEYSVVPLLQENQSGIRRRRSADTHVVYRDSSKAKSRVRRNAEPVIINQVVAPPRFTGTQLPSYKRLSPDRTLRLEVAIFVDKEFQEAYLKSPFGIKNPGKLREHIMNVMKQVQMWYFLPSLGYKIQIYITKFVLIMETVEEIGEYTDITSFCEKYQSSYLPGGSRAGNSNVTWDDAIFFSGVLGMFGERSPGEYIYGRAHRWGACNPKYQCMGINDHFEISPDLWRIERYLGRLVSHELAHTLGMADEYSDVTYMKMCKKGLMVSQYSGRSWSNCSVYELEKFLLSEFSNCLDTLPDNKNKDMIVVQAAPPDNSTENATDGGWGPWGAYGPCSKTCDGGVQLALRECNNPKPRNFGRVCTGFRYQMLMCNMQPCISDVRNKSIWDLYTEECVKTGSREDFRRDTPGIYRLNGTPACAQSCNQKGTSMWWNYKVTNGFKCRDGQDDVCVDGICMTVGCKEEDFYSATRRDKCGVCGGNGKSCRIVRGVFRGQQMGWEVAKVLPKGSRDIYITINASRQDDMRNNFIDLGEDDIDVNPFSTIPTKWTRLREGREGTYKVWWAGVLWEYMEDRWLPHFLRTKHRLQDEAIVWLRREKGALPNLGIIWQYTIDVDTPECGSKSQESWEESNESWEKSNQSWEESNESWEASGGDSYLESWESDESNSQEHRDSRSWENGRGNSRSRKNKKGRKWRGRGGRKFGPALRRHFFPGKEGI
ncbi:A disintegrin and metalloproteinase with thrombospondin motifs 12-like isoform X2 [Lineus longissimus]|uniref:A disintegrin and metalloproteinase with thrombospondin motifs 12-like isoform X2 n=1 Tax=Lineus longissimus TaxID=88925 RepID=UPI00315CCE18